MLQLNKETSFFLSKDSGVVPVLWWFLLLTCYVTFAKCVFMGPRFLTCIDEVGLEILEDRDVP